MNTKKSFSFNLFCTTCLIGALIWTSTVLAQDDSNQPLKIGYVNAAEVVSNAPQGQTALENLTDKYSTREAQLHEMQTELREIEEQLVNGEGSDLSDAQMTELRAQARSLSRELERATTDLNEDYNFDRNQHLQELQNLISEVILQMAQEEGFDLIVQSPVVWASPRIDITSAILERLEALTKQ